MKKFLGTIYAYRFFDDFILIYPLYAVMFTDFGMEPWQVALLFISWSATTFILEIPSGAWADRYSRKNILFIGQLIRVIGYLSWLLFPGFSGFLFGFICWGIKGALTSGTLQSLIYDELKVRNQENQFTIVLGRTQSLAALAIFMSSLLASLGILLGYSFVLILSVGAVLISGFLILICPINHKLGQSRDTSYWFTLKKGLGQAAKNKKIRFLIILLSVFAIGGGLDEFWTILADEVGVPNYGLGIFLGVISGVDVLAGILAPRFEKKGLRFFYFLNLSNGVLLILAALFFNFSSLVFLAFFSFFYVSADILIESKLHHTIESDARATIASVSGFLIEVVVLLFFLIFGWIAQISNYQNAFQWSGIIIVAISLIYLIAFKNRKE